MNSTDTRGKGHGSDARPSNDLTQRSLDWAGHLLTGARLEVLADDGRRWTLGAGEPHATIRVRGAAVLPRILLHPGMRFGEAYMDGRWEPADNLLEVLEVGLHLLAALERNRWLRRLKRAAAWLTESNSPRRARRNASHHYDIDFDLYRRFLDADLHYSCAYFRDASMTLEAAQQAKCAHIAAKLDLKPDARVLDIGCGWGSLAMYLAQHHHARVVGITLSEEQYKVATRRAAERGLAGRVEFRVQDYRRVEGCFDAIVSVGMFEHVGRPQYPAFFRRVYELLADDGTVLLHSIGRSTPPGGSNAWVQKYIFPGGYVPAASEMVAAVEPAGLIVTDLEIWRLHYARTLAEWHRRFQTARADIAARMGERFCRMWEFYLQVSEAGFRWGDLVVFQLQMSRTLERLPLIRDYLYRRAIPVRAREVA
ncbi:MAG: class I SAM-dependent methyltransferase [Gammaproteobacteria bacterium]|nr:class I SAM-dependent methyltransferase [Gammaproteobacteria bacterium]